MMKKTTRIITRLPIIGALALLALLTVVFACTLEPEIAELHKKVIEANSYTVTFDVMGGEYPVASQRVLKGGKVALPTPHPKYDAGGTDTFGWWWYLPDPSSDPADLLNYDPWDFETFLVNGDLTLYASWSGHAVVFFGNGGKFGTADYDYEDSIADDDPFPAGPVPTRDGYKFAKWTTKPGGTVDAPTTIEASIAVYAQWDKIIDIAAIPGVTKPAAGATPVTAITETAQYTGTVAWEETATSTPHTGPFAPDTEYTAIITLTAKAGFTLDGVAANFFTVAGATTVINAANSGIVTADFPQTASAPVETDYSISGSYPYDGYPQTPVIDVVPLKSTGIPVITNYNDGLSYNSATPPTNAGTYTVTFNVPADPPLWDPATGLEVTFTIDPITPTDAHYTINGAGAVSLISPPYSGDGGTTNVQFSDDGGMTWTSGSPPTTGGPYDVMFDVNGGINFIAATGILGLEFTPGSTPNGTPVGTDFSIAHVEYDGNPQTAVITPEAWGSPGGISIISYSTPSPTDAGDYTVTFNVGGTPGWDPASGLTATFTIDKRTPTLADYSINPSTGDVTLISSMSGGGAITVEYNDGVWTTTVPTESGTYAVRFSDAGGSNILATGPLTGFDYTVPPQSSDFEIIGTFTYNGSVQSIVITPIAGKSNGTTSNISYLGRNHGDTSPENADTYDVTFDIAAVPGTWAAATGLTVEFTIDKKDPDSGDYYVDASGDVVLNIGLSGDGGPPYNVQYDDGGWTSTVPLVAGTYPVKFDVTGGDNFNLGTDIEGLDFIVP